MAARQRGEECLLERGVLRRLTTGELIDPEWLQVEHPQGALRVLKWYEGS